MCLKFCVCSVIFFFFLLYINVCLPLFCVLVFFLPFTVACFLGALALLWLNRRCAPIYAQPAPTGAVAGVVSTTGATTTPSPPPMPARSSAPTSASLCPSPPVSVLKEDQLKDATDSQPHHAHHRPADK